MSSRRFDEGDDPFAGGTPADVDAQIYGGESLTELDTGRMVGQPINIMDIWPDMKQPRRAIPLVVRGQWDGNPELAAAVLSDWHQLAEHDLSDMIEVRYLLRGLDKEYTREDEAAAMGFVDLVGLAGSILHEGLNHPISVVRQGSRYVIESGERRWLAYHLLRVYEDADKYATIPAHVKTKADAWAQAAENGARKSLNAIGMARQLALLIMDMYEGEDGLPFGEFDHVVLPGECDRKFYAQVADGKLWPVKRGMGTRVLHVTGLKSAAQVSQYRRLLSIPDRLWMEADENDWPEFVIRENVSEPKPRPSDVFRPKTGDVLTNVNSQGEKPREFGTPRPFGQQNLPHPPTPSPQDLPHFTSPPDPLSIHSEGEEEQETVESGEGAFYPRQESGNLPVAVSYQYVTDTLGSIGRWSMATTQDGAVTSAVNHLQTLTPNIIREAIRNGQGDQLKQGIGQQGVILVRFMEERWNEVVKFMDSLAGLIDGLTPQPPLPNGEGEKDEDDA